MVLAASIHVRAEPHNKKRPIDGTVESSANAPYGGLFSGTVCPSPRPAGA